MHEVKGGDATLDQTQILDVSVSQKLITDFSAIDAPPGSVIKTNNDNDGEHEIAFADMKFTSKIEYKNARLNEA